LRMDCVGGREEEELKIDHSIWMGMNAMIRRV